MENMNHPKGTSQSTLGKVLDAFVEAGPKKETLKAFIERYPEHRSELIDFAAHWGVQEYLAAGDVPDDVEQLVLRGHKIAMQQFSGLDDRAPQQDGGTAQPSGPSSKGRDQTTREEGSSPEEGQKKAGCDVPPSFEALLKKKGLDFACFSDASGLGFSTLANLSTSRLTFASGEKRQRVAEVLAGYIEEATAGEVSADVQLGAAVEQSLARPPRQTAGAHRAEKVPEVTTQDFFEAIREDREMSAEAKRRWLRLQEE